MANNVDLIQIVSSASGGVSACSDCSDTFLAKTNGIFGGYIADATSSEKTKWAVSGDTATFTLGTLSSTDVGTLTVQGSTDADAIVYVKSNDGSSTSITPTTVTVENIAGNPVSNLGLTTITGNLMPHLNDTNDLGSTSVRWHNVYAENVDLDGTLSVTALTLSGDLTVNGNTIIGNADSDTLTVNASTTFNDSFTVPNAAGTINTGNNLIETAGRINCTGTNASNFVKLECSTAPASATSVIRKQDVDLTTATLAGKIAKITVANNLITDAVEAVAADIPAHASSHKTTSLTGDAPAGTPPVDDPLTFSDIGAVGRTNPVVKNALKITSSTNYNPNHTSVDDYFKVIEAGQTPATSGPSGQIIFRKAT